MNIVIRQAIVEDARTISRLSEQLGYKMSVFRTAEQIDAIWESVNDIAAVAVVNRKVIGWIHVFYTMRLECNSYCEIGGLVVDDQYRGNGVGKMLIDHIKLWCESKKCRTLRVRSNVKRSEAHEFYKSAGFVEIKEQKVFEIRL